MSTFIFRFLGGRVYIICSVCRQAVTSCADGASKLCNEVSRVKHAPGCAVEVRWAEEALAAQGAECP